MKAPQDCAGVNPKLEAKKSKKKKKNKDGEEEDGDSVNRNGTLTRRSSNSSITPSVNTTTSTMPTTTPASKNTPRKHIAIAPPPTKYVSTPIAPNTSSGGGNAMRGKVLFKYDATSVEELSVKPSDILTIVEPDDGSGWILAKIGRDEGLVPASYVEIQTTSEAPKKGPPVAPRRGVKKTEEKKSYFRAMYDYDANSELELSIREGDMLVLAAEDKGDGWTEVEMKGKTGSVPSNYIEFVDKP